MFTLCRASHAVIALASLALAACSRDEPRHYATPKESVPVGVSLPGPSSSAPRSPGSLGPSSLEPKPGPNPATTPPPTGSATPSGLPVPEAPRPGAGVAWSLPEKWTQERGSGMRFATIRTAEGLEIAVVTLGGAAGGELANVNRWRGQLGLPPADEASLEKARFAVKSAAGSIGVFDLVGPGEPASRMIAGILSVPDANTWFFKMTGGAKALEGAKAGYLRFLESLRLE